MEDIDRDAQYLEITPEQFIDTYLEKEEYGINYQTKHKPCTIFCRKTVTVNWAIVSLIVVKISIYRPARKIIKFAEYIGYDRNMSSSF